MGKNMEGMGQRAKGYGAVFSSKQSSSLKALARMDFFKSSFGCVLNLLFLRKKIIEDADDLLLLGKRGNTHANA